MPTTGYIDFTTAANVAGGGADWTTPASCIVADDTNRASVDVSALDIDTSDYMRISGLTTGIPTGATIDQIVVDYLCMASQAAVLRCSGIYLARGGTQISSAITSGSTWGLTEAYKSNTFSSAIMGAGWTAANIDSMQVYMKVLTTSDDIITGSVDYARVTVTYTEAATDPWSSGKPAPMSYRLNKRRRSP